MNEPRPGDAAHRFDDSWSGGDFRHVTLGSDTPYLCLGCRRAGACHIGLTRESADGDAITFELEAGHEYEGAPGIAHGRWAASAFDEILGRVPMYAGSQAVTKSLTVRYRKPVPIVTPLVGRASIEHDDGRTIEVIGDLRIAATGAVVGEGNGKFVRLDASHHVERFQTWMQQQDHDNG